MEPVTHVLTGACLARAGLNRRAAYATMAMAIAAELPDIDTVWSLRGPVEGFQHHRGITHTFLGIPFEAALVVFCFYVWHQWRKRRQRFLLTAPSGRTAGGLRTAPVRWGMLYGLVLLALLSHILLDFTNNYGVRPFFPFNPHWYAASIVFIFDPLLFLLLLGGLLLPGLFGLIGREVGGGREPFRGAGWARAALLSVLLLWGVRWVEHTQALTLAEAQVLRAPGSGALKAPSDPPDADSPTPTFPRALLRSQASLASPDPLSIFRWYTVTDFGPAYQLATADTHHRTETAGLVLTKPESSPALLAAERSRLGQVYLDWSPMPFLTVSKGAPEGYPDFGNIAAVVRFADPRFMGDIPLLHSSGDAPLTGTVLLDAQDKLIAQGMDGRFEQR